MQEAAIEYILARAFRTMAKSGANETHEQLLHLVVGGELTDIEHHEFRDLSKLDIVGMFPDYATAYDAWKEAAQRTVDNAQTRYFVVHVHKLLEPEMDEQP